jgi:cytochrome P450
MVTTDLAAIGPKYRLIDTRSLSPPFGTVGQGAARHPMGGPDGGDSGGARLWILFRRQNISDEVPAVLIDDLPTLDLGLFETDPSAALDVLRPHRIVRSSRGLEVISYDLGYKLLGDARLRPMSAEDFVSHGATPYVAEFVNQGVFLFMPPERHARIRRIFMKGFSGKQLGKVREAISAAAHHLADRLAERGEGDLVEDFTLRLSSQSLCLMVGIPVDDIDDLVHSALDLRKLVYVPMEPHVPTIEAALRHLHSYATDLLDRRRREPQDDFLSALISGEQDGTGLSNDELVWGTVNLLLGGIDTSNFQLASIFQHLIILNEWDRVAAEPNLQEAAIEEAMRLTPVSTMLSRIVDEDFTIDGVEFQKGIAVRINMVAAGRDPDRFDSPHFYKLDRKLPSFPMMFGNGPHACIGRALAMHELRSGLDVLTSRLTDVAFRDEPTMHLRTESFFGPHSLPVTLRSR